MSAALSLVEDNRPPTEPPTESLSPARKYLAKVRQRRDEAGAALGAAVASHQKVEKLLSAPAPIAARIAAFEAEHARLIEIWAGRADDSAPPELPHAAQLKQLQAELREAEMVAAGARAALPRLQEAITECQAGARVATESLSRATDAVLVEEAAVLAAELAAAEARAALLMGRLTALAKFFELEARRRPNNSPAAMTVNDFVPPRPSLTNEAVTEAMSTWAGLARRLFAGENATFEEIRT